MKVDRSRAVRRQIAGETLYFCSDHCVHAFQGSGREAPDPVHAG
jgi:YHS domain-containing protein